jgi:phage shock protein PspC (stress-responsive transcriptional regulator)
MGRRCVVGFRRSKRDRWIFGVCGGIAHHYGYKPWAVRLAVAIVAIAIPGVSVIPALLVYILLGFLVPESDLY